jgi:hypothetical protein
MFLLLVEYHLMQPSASIAQNEQAPLQHRSVIQVHPPQSIDQQPNKRHPKIQQKTVTYPLTKTHPTKPRNPLKQSSDED